MTKIILLLFCTLTVQLAVAQDEHLSSKKGQNTFGLGIGLPYGALGIRFGTNLVDHLNLFGGAGYQISGLGYNFGLMKDFKSSRATQFYLVGMYGTNGAIKIEGLPEYDNLYTGATFGAGMKINSRSHEGNYWDLGLLLPLRSSDFKETMDTLERDSRVTGLTSPWPVLIVVGYNFNL